MPHSLRAKIKGLRYKGIITDKDCDRLRKALDNEDVLDKIRNEIEAEMNDLYKQKSIDQRTLTIIHACQRHIAIIDEHREEQE